MLLFFSVFMAVSSFGETADIIKQNQTSMLLSEGSNATLSCTYDGYVNSLHWYQQKPGSRPEFLLLIMESNRHITKAETLDDYSTSNVNRLYWYRQYPSSELDYLLYIFESWSLSDPLLPGFSAKVQNKRVDLLISSAKSSDSALNYCALEPTLKYDVRKDFYEYNHKHHFIKGMDLVLLGIICTGIVSILDPDQSMDLVLLTTICTGIVSILDPDQNPLKNVHTETTMMFLCSLTVFIIMLNSCVSQSIAPLDDKVLIHAHEDETVTLSCKYNSSGTGNYLHWYRQYPGSRPECSLTVFIIMIESCVSQSISPLENKVLVHALEDKTVTLSCKYEYSGDVNSLQWYRQYPGSRPEYLLMIIPTTKAVSHATPPFPRLNATEHNKTVDLIISSAEVSDSALYYCALQPTVTGNPATLYKNILHHSCRVTFVGEAVCLHLIHRDYITHA
ncbi:uncharacterized protein LOC119264939 [Pygocentrus nattereri]|uniref:uncharacterized protein LOC119264939 n=1 Tax=Pygocentrus nattereri TaxID=42514 RepID=UPI001891874F|nr:uncharacterized protein LOC119264939 [Pygocentrus nattereri]